MQPIRGNPGTTTQANLRWLIAFLKTDPQRMSTDQLSHVLRAVRSMARLAVSSRSPAFPRWEIPPDSSPATTPGNYVYRGSRLRGYLAHLQKVLARAIRELTSPRGRTVLYVSTSISEPSLPFDIQRGRTTPALVIEKGTINEVFRAFDIRILIVLQEHASRLAACRECSTVFLRTRTDKEYCSPGCGTLERVRRWRAKHAGTKKGGRHGTKRQQGPRHR
ncbi:MAG: hypothetical protein ACRDGM_07755 [bacterium]